MSFGPCEGRCICFITENGYKKFVQDWVIPVLKKEPTISEVHDLIGVTE